MRTKAFVGVALDEHSRAACRAVAERLQSCGVRGRFESAEKLHLTLAFLGYVDAERLGAASGAAADCAARTTPFVLHLDKIGAFPHERAPRIAYLGARDAGASFRSASAQVRASYAALGWMFPKAPVAHVTLVRIAAENRAPLPSIDVAPIQIRVDAFTVFESLPDEERHTTRYRVLNAFALGGR